MTFHHRTQLTLLPPTGGSRNRIRQQNDRTGQVCVCVCVCVCVSVCACHNNTIKLHVIYYPAEAHNLGHKPKYIAIYVAKQLQAYTTFAAIFLLHEHTFNLLFVLLRHCILTTFNVCLG